MEAKDSQEGLLPLNNHNISEKLKKVAEVELNEKESETQAALIALKDLLRSKCLKFET